MAESESVGHPSQVTLKTAFTVCFAVVAVVALVVLVLKAEVAIILTGIAALIAVALDHLVALLMRRTRLKRGPSIALVLVGLLLLGIPGLAAGAIAAVAGFGIRAGAIARGWSLPAYRR